MTVEEYQKLASRTMNPDLTEYECIMHGVFGLCSEAGEVASIFQKQYQGHRPTEEHLVKELGDVLWMVAEICTANRMSLEDVMKENIKKLEARYPNGFEAEKSLHRQEGDI